MRFNKVIKEPLWLLFLVIIVSCSPYKGEKLEVIEISQNNYTLQLPPGFDSLPIPENNKLSIERIALGKRLFQEKALSIDSSISCLTCHKPNLYFTDGFSKSKGLNGEIVERNSPSLLNVGYQTKLLREGGMPTLEMQVLVPIQEHKEFNFNIVDLSERLKKDSIYVRLAKDAYNREIDPFVITRALSAYERTLISGNSNYDKYFYQGNKKSLSKDELKGYKLFISSEINCISCHSGFNFTNYKTYNNGLYEKYIDPGRARLTNLDSDKGKFKVPSLRNIEFTGPYMHDGSIETLEEIIRHYASGGKNHPNKSELLQGFSITKKEINYLVSFLKSLTDTTVINKY